MFAKAERIALKDHAEISEAIIESYIVADPTVLGLGDVVVKDRQRIHPRAGRLDLLLQDIETNRRYEVEIQLGPTDETHLIRTIEYWDVERKRYPQYDHCAVIVAEDITSRFLNVISLFNGTIPLVAVQMQALRIGGQLALVFTTVLDEFSRGLVDEDEELTEVTDRAYWETKGSRETVAVVDELLKLVQAFAPQFELKYNKFYIGLAKNGQPNNFVIFRAKKKHVLCEPRLKPSDETKRTLEASGLETLEYDSRWGRFRIRLTAQDVRDKGELLSKLLRDSFDGAHE